MYTRTGAHARAVNIYIYIFFVYKKEYVYNAHAREENQWTGLNRRESHTISCHPVP